MKLGQLKKKIIKEFAKSPAKTVTLIVLCPVALYFVVPLFWRAQPPVDAAQRVQVIAPNPDSFTKPPACPVAASAASPGPTWRQLIDCIEADWRRKPGQISANQRNPFQTPEVAVEPSEAVREVPPEASIAPPAFSQEAFEAIGFRLTGTLVGRHSRSATINGKRYLEGATVTPPQNRQPAAAGGELAFVLKHVGTRHVILALDELRFRLALPAALPPGTGITVVRGTPQAFP